MSCKNFENCYNDETNTMEYPIDSESMYANRYYDEQTAKSRCYAKKPINIIEGFGLTFTWTNLIKVVVVILLIFLAYSLSKDFMFPKEVITIGVTVPSEFSLDQPSIIKQ
jgi:hypothetical protein